MKLLKEPLGHAIKIHQDTSSLQFTLSKTFLRNGKGNWIERETYWMKLQEGWSESQC